ncbi:MAG: hypothetical protein KBA71_02235 [Opitutaceae bacterium]|nr:hypothetical protein [Opitutaceae bacterium]
MSLAAKFMNAATILAILFLSVGAAASHGQAPDSLAGTTYREDIVSLGGPSKGTAFLHADGTYETVISQGKIGRISSYGGIAGAPPEKGTYTYTRTGPATGTLSFTATGPIDYFSVITFFHSTSEGPPARIVRALNFATEHKGTLSLAPPLDDFVISRGEFEISRDAAPLLNASVRGSARADKPLILGFVVSGSSRTVLIRGIGPTLASFDVPNPATSTHLELYSVRQSIVITTNSQWESSTSLAENGYLEKDAAAQTLKKAFQLTGAFPLPEGSRDSAILRTLRPGSYTVILKTASAEDSEVLGEIYIIP